MNCLSPVPNVTNPPLSPPLRAEPQDEAWLHVLGALHQDRLSRFTLLGVSSSDSKQWARAYTRYRDFKGTSAAYRRGLRERFMREQYFQRQICLPGLEPAGPLLCEKRIVKHTNYKSHSMTACRARVCTYSAQTCGAGGS